MAEGAEVRVLAEAVMLAMAVAGGALAYFGVAGSRRNRDIVDDALTVVSVLAGLFMLVMGVAFLCFAVSGVLRLG